MFQRTLIPLFATLMAVGLIVSGLLTSGDRSVEGRRFDTSKAPPWTQATEDNPTGSYRFTINGWEDTALWRLTGEEGKVNFIDDIHPLVWMLVVILLAIGLAILVSDEESVSRLWSNK